MEQLAYCKVAVSPVRAEASDTSEIVTQLLFGEVITILETDKQWRKIQSFHDNYEGWIDSKQIHQLTKKEANRWRDSQEIELSLARELNTPWGKQVIVKGSFVSADREFNIGDDVFSFADNTQANYKTITEFARTYLNAPYLWGGKTPFGIDCSGFVQIVHRAFHYNLPRDASQQAEYGQDVDFEDRQTGDLAFFVNAKGNIHHVGILLSEVEIIHASGCVRIDEFTKNGIFNRENEELTHQLLFIKRL